ncbi:MAG: radical SAM family heme chaperone HemW [Bacteroidales bacterium]|nr:radical SAM family heme chaperone HemW [Bacteroidales bacterium]
MAGLYIHIPFCAQFCGYCDFYSVDTQKWMPELIQALKKEMALRRDYISAPQTLYIGGGTPSLCKVSALSGLVDTAKELWKNDFKEVTVEVNPEDLTPAYCKELAGHRFNRLSIGIQSFFDEHLQFMNRRHSAAQGVRAVQAARQAGFGNISIDLMFGFPGLSQAQWRQNIEQALSLRPEHLSAYQLSMEPGTPFFKGCAEGWMQPVEGDEAANQYALLQELLPAAGLRQYEVSNFAREGYRSLHNSSYWQGIPYLGLGPSAHSYNGRLRHVNMCSLKVYLKKMSHGWLPIKEEQLTHKKKYNEFVMTRLRTAEGFLRREIEQHIIRPAHLHHFEQAASRLLERGLLLEQEGRITIPPQKWFVSDGIIVDLLV